MKNPDQLRRLNPAFIACGLGLAAILILNAAIIPVQTAHSQNSAAVPSSEVTIQAVGEASLSLEPDQVTLVLGKQSRVANSSDIVDEQKSETAKVISAIESAVAGDVNTTVSAGSFYLNPFYSGSGYHRSPSSTYSAYLNVPVTVDADDVAEAADKIAEAGFYVESIYLTSSSMFPGYPGGFGYGAGFEQPSEEAVEPENGNATDPYQVTLSIAITSQPDTLANVMSQYEQLSDRIDVLLDELGIPEDERQPPSAHFVPEYSDFGIQPYANSQYSLHSQVIVKTDPANIDRVIEAASAEGAYVESFSPSFSDAAIDSARVQLNQQALENAMERANEMGSPLGLQVQAVKSISVGSSGDGLAGLPLYRGVSMAFPFPYAGVPSEQLSVTVVAEFQMG